MKLHEFPPNILALITAYLEYDTALALIHLSGDVILRHKVEVQDGLTDITITKKKSLFLFFRRCCPTGLKPRTLNIRLLDESPPGLDFPTLLAPSLLEICIEWRFGPELFFRPVEAGDTDCILAESPYVVDVLQKRTPLLHILNVKGDWTGYKNSFWDHSQFALFLRGLPPTLTSFQFPVKDVHEILLPPSPIVQQLSTLAGTSLSCLYLYLHLQNLHNAGKTPSKNDSLQLALKPEILDALAANRLPELTSLNVDTYRSPLPFATTIFPNLTKLRLAFGSQSGSIHLVLPPLLTDLSIKLDWAQPLNAVVAALPKTLRNLRVYYATIPAEQHITSVFPPALTTLSLSCARPLSLSFVPEALHLPQLAHLELFARISDLSTVTSVQYPSLTSLIILHSAWEKWKTSKNWSQLTSIRVWNPSLIEPILHPDDFLTLPPGLRHLRAQVSLGPSFLTPDVEELTPKHITAKLLSMSPCSALTQVKLSFFLEDDFFAALASSNVKTLDDAEPYPLPYNFQRQISYSARHITLPRGLTRLAGFSRCFPEPIDIRTLPTTLTELDASSWEWVSVENSDVKMPTQLKKLSLQIGTIMEIYRSAPHFSFEHFERMPFLESLSLTYPMYETSTDWSIGDLPRNLTELNLKMSPDAGNPIFSDARYWPLLRHLAVSFPISLRDIQPLLSTLESLNTPRLFIDADLLYQSLKDDILLLSLPSSIAHLRHYFLPSRIRLNPDALCCVRWTLDTLKLLPPTLTSANLVFHEMHHMTSALKHAPAPPVFPPGLTYLYLESDYAIRVLGHLPRGLRHLAIDDGAIQRSVSFSLIDLPPELLSFSIAICSTATKNNLQQLPASLTSLSLNVIALEPGFLSEMGARLPLLRRLSLAVGDPELLTLNELQTIPQTITHLTLQSTAVHDLEGSLRRSHPNMNVWFSH